MSDEVTVIVEQIDESVIVEVNPINDEVTVIISSVVNTIGVTKPELDALNVAFTDEENVFTEIQELAKEKGFYTAPSGIQRYQIKQEGNNMIILGLAANGDELQPAMIFNINDGYLSAAGLDLGFILGKFKELHLSSYANVLGVKSSENSATKVFASDGSVVDLPAGEANTINTELEAGMTGEDLVLNVLSLTQAEYDAGTPIATTFYIITD